MHNFLAGILYDIISLEFFRVKVLFNLSLPCTVITSENFKFARATQVLGSSYMILVVTPLKRGTWLR